jgi:hypothetical protein
MIRWLAMAVILLLSPAPAFAAPGAVSISASASTQTPYQNQSLLYTVKVVAHTAVSNVSLGELRADNAIVERQGEPLVRRGVENGAPANIVEFNFVITPLQPGPAVIAPVVLSGEIETPDGAGPSDGGFMAGMLRALNAISSFAGGQPFSIASNRIVLNVRPPAAAMDLWLPLTSLKITEDMPGVQSVHVGDLLSRKITLSANGAVASQLPDVEGQQNHSDFKVYSDKPATGQTIDKTGAILAWRAESFSLVPQHPGMLVLPAVTVSWWNVAANQAASAVLPQRILKVLPGAAPQNSDAGNADPSQDRAASNDAAPSKRPTGIPDLGAGPWKMQAAALIGGLMFIALGWLVWGKFRFAGNHRGAALKTMSRLGRSQPDSTSLAALKHVRAPEDLKLFFQSYAHQHWGLARNASLEKIFAARGAPSSGREKDDIDAIIKGISAALYAGKPVDMEDLKTRCQRVITASKKSRARHRKAGQTLAGLNPD